jgi:putative FmdB family regulatory protein
MPIYEYLCPDGHRFEVVQRFADEPIMVCEVCGKPVQRVLHAPAVHYKGKGFYATDYGRRKTGNGDTPDSGASESGSKEAAASSSSGSGSDGNSSSKSESKGSDSKGSGGGEGSSSKKTDAKPAA